MNIKKWLVLSWTLLLAVACHSDTSKFVISGDVSALTKEGEVYLWEFADTAKGINEIYRVPVKDGQFTIQGNLDNPQKVGLVVEVNQSIAHKMDFILEPGELTVRYVDKVTGVKVDGGKYYDIAISSWQSDAEYIEHSKELADFIQSMDRNASEEEQEKSRVVYRELSQKQSKRKSHILQSAYDASSDPQERFLLIQQGALGGDDRKSALKQLAKEMPNNPHVSKYLERIERAESMQAKFNSIKVGTKISDFTAEDLQGSNIKLSEVLESNKYVLVEFWASWCGPCRAEIPHMKRAYQEFNGKGFEIMSFSLDHERSDWEDASYEEELPWLNTSDLLAYQSPIVQMFGVQGIPRNFLVQPDGTIIAMNLRQESLDHKLEELL